MSVYSPDVQIDNPVTVAGGIIDATGSAVSVTNFPSSSTVTGSVSVSNFPATQPVSGSVSVSNLPATQAVSGTISVSGTVSTITANASTATISQVSLAAVDQTLLAANANRKRMVIFSAGGKTLIALGNVASNTSFTYNLSAANSTVEISGWTGTVHAIQSGGTSVVTTTELV